MKPSILIADDEPNQLELMAYNLKKADFVIHQAENGEEALEKVEELSPDLVILDWMMPNMSGIEVCRILRSKVETKKIPIIILSARSEDVDKSLGLDTGADDYISKPFLPLMHIFATATKIPPKETSCADLTNFFLIKSVMDSVMFSEILLIPLSSSSSKFCKT